MPWKKPTDLSQDDKDAMLLYLLGKAQDLEVVLAQVTMVVLADENQIVEPTEEEYQYTLDQLKTFLVKAYENLQRINSVTDKLQAEVHSSN